MGRVMHSGEVWRQLALAGVLAALCPGILGFSVSCVPNASRTSIWVPGSRHSIEGQLQASGLAASMHHRSRNLLQSQDELAADAPFDPMPDIPVSRLNWLKEPSGGWETWEPPPDKSSGQEGSVAIAGVAEVPNELPSKSTRAAQLVVLQLSSHLRAAAAMEDMHAFDSSAGMQSAVTELPAHPSARSLPIAALGNGTSTLALRATVAAAAEKPARKPTPRSTPHEPFPKPSHKPVHGLKTFTNVMQRTASMPFPSNMKIPPTGLVLPPAAIGAACLLSYNVTRFGACGNGVTSVVIALRNANRARATRVLYFPVGVYRITSNLILSKPVVMGARTRFQLDPGVVLSLVQQPRRAPIWHDPMFTGAGRVLMGGKVGEVYPAWWSDPRLSDDQVLQSAVRSCMVACTVLQTRTLFFKNAVQLSPRVGIFSTANAGIVAASRSKGKGLLLPAGIYKRPVVLTSVRGFAKFGVAIMPGVRGLDLQAGHVTNNNQGIVFQGRAGSPIYNVTLSHVSIMQSNQHSIVFNSPTSNILFSGITVRVNFLLTGGFLAPSEPSSGVLFRGIAPKLKSPQVVVQAIDPGQFMKITQFAAVATQTQTPVSNFVFRSESWNGGYKRPGTQIAGTFRNSRFQIRFSDGIGGSIFSFKSGSRLNWLSNNEMAAPSSFWVLVPVPGTLKQFIAANPRAPPQPLPMQFPGPARQQGFYVSLKTNVAWPPARQRTYYLHSYFADPAVSGKVACIPYQTANPGLFCVSVAAAPLPTERHRIAVKLINLSRKVIPASTRHYFGIQVGPG